MKKSLKSSLLMLSVLLFTNHAAAQGVPVSVDVGIVKSASWQSKIKLTGKLIASEGIIVKSEVPGRVTNIYFHSGDTVKKGSPLIMLNSKVLLAQKKLVENDLQLSRLEFNRKNNLYKKHALSKAELDIATARLKSDEVKIEQINAQIDQAHIEAPFSGKLGLRKVSIGDYLTPGQAIVNLQAKDPIYVDFDVPEVYLHKLKSGLDVNLTTPAYPEESFAGVVEAFESVINPGTQSLTVRAKLNNADYKLIPGTFVDITVFLGKKQQVVMIPQTAVVYTAEGDFVYTTDGKTVHKSKIMIGGRTDKTVIIKDGIKAGEKIVTIGTMKLYEGATIFVAQPDGSIDPAKKEKA